MGFFSSIFGCSKNGGDDDKPRRYVTGKAFREILAKQATMSPQTIAALSKYGVTDETHLKLEFFFGYDDSRLGPWSCLIWNYFKNCASKT